MSPPPASRDRRQLLAEPGAEYNGIDYVDVAVSQTELHVHFINQVPVAGSLTGNPPVTITGGEVVTTVAVQPIDETADWSADSQGRPVLRLTVAAPGDFSDYTLTITASVKLDPFFAAVTFSFKANCSTTLDCATPEPACPVPPEQPVPIDYLAKDFNSFRQALSEFSTLRYPAWVERSEADVGMMLMEALSAIADELSYYQDRVAAESALPTATQRLSVIRHARLVDYEPAPATTATTVLALDVAVAATINTPVAFRALAADGTVIDFEIEDPAAGITGSISFAVDPRWNRANLTPYYWDDGARCLLAKSTDFYLENWNLGLAPGQRLLLDSPAADGADPPARELVTIASTAQTTDPVLGQELTRVFLTGPTTLDHDLSQDATSVAGNIVPAVHGLRRSEEFGIPAASDPPGAVVVRSGANWTPERQLADYRYCLSAGPLAWLATDETDEDTAVAARPEIVLTGTPPTGPASGWTFERWLLGAPPSGLVYTLTPEQYSPVLTSDGVTWRDYDGDGGTTIRFGDGTSGFSPEPGTSFTVLYRTGGGTVGNVPAGALTTVAPGQAQGSIIKACTNPFPAAGGQDAETIAQVRARAPQKFQAEPLRVVRAEDYVAAAQSQPWVQQAGTTFRWTGSWLTVLTSADPAGAEEPTIGELTSLTGLLNQRRLAGYESYVLPPRYSSIDLVIIVCGKPDAFGGDVEAAVLARLQPGPLPDGGTGFFDHSQWSFGKPLESSALFAAIQSCVGVDGVYQASYRERGVQLDWVPLPQTLTFASDQILRVDNDPSRPEAGSLQVTVEGSK